MYMFLTVKNKKKRKHPKKHDGVPNKKTKIDAMINGFDPQPGPEVDEHNAVPCSASTNSDCKV